MKRTFTLLIFCFIVFSCKKEISHIGSDHYLRNVKSSLKDSLSNNDYSSLDFSKAVLNKVDSVDLYFLRVPFKGNSVASDFILVKTSKDGKIERGKIIHLEGKVNQFGAGTVKQRGFDGSISISSFSRKEVMNSTINNGYITAFHQRLNTREQLKEADALPEVVVVAYVNYDYGIDFSTWYYLTSFFGNGMASGGGGGSDTGGYYGSAGDGYYGGGGGGSYGSGTGDSYGGTTSDPTMLVDVDTYVNKDPIDIEQYLKCFDNIPDVGSQCEIGIYSDIPVDSDPNKIFDFSTGSPGHSFIQIKKISADGTTSVVQNVGFYPKTGWKTITNFPVDAKFVDDGQHEFNASLNKTLTPEQFRSVISKIHSLGNSNYDLDDFNCTDWALSVFNSQGYTLTIPRYLVPGSIKADGVNTPQGIYNKLKEMKDANVPGSDNISIGFMKAWVTNSNGPCN
jgi:hypothetical protein